MPVRAGHRSLVQHSAHRTRVSLDGDAPPPWRDGGEGEKKGKWAGKGTPAGTLLTAASCSAWSCNRHTWMPPSRSSCVGTAASRCCTPCRRLLLSTAHPAPGDPRQRTRDRGRYDLTAPRGKLVGRIEGNPGGESRAATAVARGRRRLGASRTTPPLPSTAYPTPCLADVEYPGTRWIREGFEGAAWLQTRRLGERVAPGVRKRKAAAGRNDAIIYLKPRPSGRRRGSSRLPSPALSFGDDPRRPSTAATSAPP